MVDISDIINSKDSEQAGYKPISHNDVRTGYTPIMTALFFGTQVPRQMFVETIELLSKVPDIDLSLQNNYGQTALIMAAMYNASAIPILLAQNSRLNINAKDNEGNTALIHAVSRNDEETVTSLLSVSNINITLSNNQGESALKVAQDSNYEGIASTLETTLTSQSDRFLTAAKEGDLDTVESLIGIYVNTKDSQGNTALIEASRRGQARVVRRLLSHPDIRINEKASRNDTTALLAAVLGNHNDVINMLLDHPKTNLNVISEQGRNTLMWAAFLGETDIVRDLISKGADLNMQDRFVGNTALMFAAEGGKEDVVRIILTSGKYIENHRNRLRQTAAMVAQGKGNHEMSQLLNSFFINQRGR